jgi:thiol-disulfide isomerase/thioredoxin
MGGSLGLVLALVALAAGDPAPATLDAITPAGRRAAIDLPGQVTVVDFFATWCPHCRESLADYGGLMAKYGDRARLIVVDVEEPAETVAQFFARHPLPEGVTLVLDPRGQVVRRFGPKAYPSIYVLDANGVVRSIQRGWGEGSADDLGRAIERASEKPKPEVAAAGGAGSRRARRRARPSPAGGAAADGITDGERAQRMGVEILH